MFWIKVRIPRQYHILCPFSLPKLTFMGFAIMITNISLGANLDSANAINLFSVSPSRERVVINPDGTLNSDYADVRPDFLSSDAERARYLKDHVSVNAARFADYVLTQYAELFQDDPRTDRELRDAIIAGYIVSWQESDLFYSSSILSSRQEEKQDWADTADENGAFFDDNVDMSDVVFDPAAETRLAFLKRWHRIRLERLQNENKADGD